MTLLEVKNLKKTYATRFGNVKVQALTNVNFTAEKGEYIAIMGESGSGKTTLLNILATLDRPTGGEVVLEGKSTLLIPEKDLASFRRDNLGFVFQDFNLLDTFSLRDNIFLPLVLAGKNHKEMSERIIPISYRLGITDILDKFPYEISGGQKQRCAIARALITNPHIILADEPTGALDSHSADALLEVFKDINSSGQTILMVTHSVKAASNAGRVLFLRDGEIFNQLYRGERTNDEMFGVISDTLTAMATGGEKMRKSVFYPKLAIQNISRNKQFYVPFILTCIATTAMFYIMCFLTFNNGTSSMQGTEYLSFILVLGCIVIALFSAIFLFYTNSFLMKRRQKEIGLYNILGMGKGNISSVLFFETLFVALITLVCGITLGILLSKLTLLVLCKLVFFSVPYGFEISVKGILYSVYLFCGIFLLILLSNLVRIKLSNPIELLHGSSVGEKEPKTKWILAILGILSLGGGYYIAITTEAPLQAIMLFFVAVILVIVGTYLLFTASSIAILKRLKSRPNYYYTTKHFIPVSGMIYRMKQNAVGLANICILATMVLVMVSGTVCLYLGSEGALKNVYPNEIVVNVVNPTGDARENLANAVKKTVSDSGLDMKDLSDLYYINFASTREGSDFGDSFTMYANPDVNSFIYLLSATEYERFKGEKIELASDEAVAFSTKRKIDDSFTIFGKDFKVTRWLDSFPAVSAKTSITTENYVFIVSDDTFADLSGRLTDVPPEWYYGFDVGGTTEQQLACRDALDAVIGTTLTSADGTSLGGYESANVSCRNADRDYFYAMYGGFLFLGLFLGLVFLIATVLIIYYKQLSEGYDDKERFEIMQKVGLSRPEIKKAIRSQVLVVFFLPLGMAVVHIAFAFKMITKLLLVFNLTNVTLFALCTLGTVALFALIYGVVYMLTAKIYYKIVS